MQLKRFLKPVITLILLALALQLVDLDKLWTTLRSTSLQIIFITISGYLIGQLLSSYKWWTIARAGGIEASFLKAIRAYFIGMFANFFGLGLVGGDLARGILLARGHDKKTPAVASVVADRAQGLAVLALIGIISALVFGKDVIAAELLWLLAGVGICIICGWIIGPATLLRLTPKTFKHRDKIEQIARVFPRDLKTVSLITLLSICFHLIQIFLHYLIIVGLGVVVPFSYLLMVIPVINILSSLPISWNGLGVRENSYIFFLAPLYLSSEQAVAVGAIWLLGVLSSSLLGGAIAIMGSDLSLLRMQKDAQVETGRPSPIAQR